MVEYRKKQRKMIKATVDTPKGSNLIRKGKHSIIALLAPYYWIIVSGFCFVLSLLLLILFTNILPGISGIDLFPTNIGELLIVLICFFLVCLGAVMLAKMLRVRIWLKTLIVIVGSLATTILIVGIALVINTLIFTESIDSKVYESVPYAVVVKKDGDIDAVSEMKGRRIGMLEKIDEANIHTFLQKKTGTKYTTVLARAGVEQLATYLLDGTVDVAVIERGRLEYLNNENDDFMRNTETIYEFATQAKVYKTKDIANLSEPFVLYINSVDSYEKVKSVIGENRVSQLMVINPRVHEVLFVDIPVNYYVEIAGMGKKKSELTIAGLYGIEKNIETIEQLYGIDVNYYVKYDDKKLDEVMNQLDGAEIETDQVSSGQIGEQQWKTITFIERLLNTSTFSTNYGNLLQAMAGTFQTDIPNHALMVGLLQQITAEHNWRFEVISATEKENNTVENEPPELDMLSPEPGSILHVKEKIEEVKNRH